MRTRWVLALGLAGCSRPATPAPHPDQAVRHVIDSMVEVRTRAVERHDSAGLADTYAADVLYIGGGDTTRGRDTLMKGFMEVLNDVESVEVRPILFFTSGDIAVLSSFVDQRLKQDARVVTAHFAVTDVRRRQSDGIWRTQVQTVTSTPDSASATK